jgi:DNA helicase-2/ATP-dependent DNA helicase PcrA
VFPHQRSLFDTKELEEERRLAYVGITRAQQRLFLSRATVRSSWGSPSYNPPSRFLEELPTELLDWRNPPKAWQRGSTGYSRSTPAIARVAAKPGVRSPGNREVISLAQGDRVSHDTYGLGTVVSTKGEGERAQAEIDFGSAGVKHLLLRYAPVVKL